MTVPVELTVNGESITVATSPMRSLLDVLRVDLGLTGTKDGCGVGVCGACSVTVDGRLMSSCLLPIALAEGSRVETIEAMADGDRMSLVQQAFVDAGAFQCGICTPGQVMAADALLEEVAAPSAEEIRYWLAGNLCRCTGYASIIQAVLDAAAAAH
jgi:aerobic carbon-monoxide dehydrogenase small subunit